MSYNHDKYRLMQEADFIDMLKERCFSEDRSINLSQAKQILLHALWSLGYKQLVEEYEHIFEQPWQEKY